MLCILALEGSQCSTQRETLWEPSQCFFSGKSVQVTQRLCAYSKLYYTIDLYERDDQLALEMSQCFSSDIWSKPRKHTLGTQPVFVRCFFLCLQLLKASGFTLSFTTRAVCACIDLGVGPMFSWYEQRELAYSKQCFLMFL